MARELRLPKLAEGDATGTVVRVLVSPGDTIAPGAAVLEVETEKAVVEVPSDIGGRVTQVYVKEGDEVRDGALLLALEEAEAEPEREEAAPVAPPAAPGAPPAAPGAPSVSAPAEAPVPPVSPADDAPPLPGRSADGPAVAKEPAAPGPRALVPAAPSVRRLARELGLDLGEVRGTGPGGRISEDDVKAHARGLAARARELAGVSGDGVAAPWPAFGPAPLPDLSRWGEVRREAIGGVRRATAQNLARSWPVVPQVTHHDEADVTELEAFRKRHAARVEALGGKLTLTAILVKVAAVALRTFPKFNAALDLARGEIVFREYVHIGIAVDTPHGLLVPVLRDADRKGIVQIARELRDLSARARERKLGLEEMQGGSFTISNLGGIGGTGFTPIVNFPEAAILGVSRAREEPRWEGDRVRPRLVLPLALSYDHRLIDGAEAARFVRWIAEALENPLLLAMEG